MTNFGATLSKKREELGLTLPEVVLKLKIKERYLSEIESWNFVTIPHKVYTKGYIKLYSAFLGLDSNQAAAEFNLELTNEKSKHSMPKTLHDYTAPRKSTVFLSFLFFIIILNLWSSNHDNYRIFDKYGAPNTKVNILSALQIDR